MKKLPLPARAYVATVVLAGAALLVVLAKLPALGQLPVFLTLALATILTSTLKLQLPTTKNRATMSLSFVVDFAALLLFGPQQAMLITAVGAVSQATTKVAHKNPLYRTLFSVSALVVTVQAAGLAYRVSGGTFGHLVWPGNAASVAVAVITYFLVNSGAIAIAVALSTYQPMRRVWQRDFLWGAPSYFVGAGVAVVIVEVIVHQMWGLLPLAVAPVYITYRAYRMYAGRLEDEHRHREVIESLNEGMAVIQRDGRVALWNDAVERITGIPRERVLGRSLIEAVPQLAGTTLPQLIDAVLESGDADDLEHFALHRAGHRRILQVRVFPFVAGVTVFWNDITDRA